jgi:uncharacterized membrane protein (UPF0182 family)
MHEGLFIASITMILAVILFLLFASIGIMMIIKGRKRRVKENRTKGILMILLGLVLGCLILWPGLSYFYIELLWFKSLGFETIFWELNNLPWILYVKFTLMALGFLLVNFIIAWKLCPIPGSFQRWGAGRTSTINRVLVASIVLVSLIMGSFAVPFWDDYRRYEEKEPYLVQNSAGKEEVAVDPQFGEDLSYYLFDMPIRNFTSLWTKGLFLLSLLATGIQYDAYRRRDSQSKIYVMKRGVFHLSFLWLLVLAVSIWRSTVNIHRLVYSENGFTFGAGYTDVNLRIPAYHIYMVIIGIVALTVIINSFWKKKFMVTIPIALWVGSYIILLWVIPTIYQYIRVSPNEPILEHDYIDRNIHYTRLGFDLERIKVSEIVPEVATLEKVSSHPATLKNVQLWDRRATREYLNQNQVFRPYYSFHDVDADRYQITDPITGQKSYRQVMITAREIDSNKLDPKSKTWVTQKLTYTHGYGVCLGPVNQFTPKGEPYLWVKGIPPSISYPELKITRPEIYFGETTEEHVFVHTSQKEFDYPAQEGKGKNVQDHYTTYDGNGGILVSSFLRRCMIATRALDFRIITSAYLKPESRVLFNRQVVDRVKRVAPFLLYDDDPYIVIGDSGKLWWIIDVYTTSKGFPYSEPYNGDFNYIRNPFKAVVDAYNGTVNFYVWDENEIITKVYKNVFPEMFKSKKEMPDGLEKHNRYPTDMTQIQSDMYCLYHMEDPQAFFSRADRWDIPHETYYQPRETKLEKEEKAAISGKEALKSADKTSIAMVPLYVMITVPNSPQNDPEFVSIISFTPWPTRDRPNMVAWMVVRNDVPHYGEILTYVFPKGQPIPGPAQIESKIDTNPEMSEKLTLWNEGGSTVIRGNMLVVPVDNAIFFVEPIYLQAQIATMPILTQIVVAAGDKIAWGENFDMAMEKVFGIGEKVEPDTGVPVDQDPLTAAISAINAKLSQYKTQIQSNDPNVGQTVEELKKLFIELEKYKK